MMENKPMRCPECKHNQKYRDGTRCGKCGYQFVLIKKKGDGLSDFALRQIIQRLSDGGQQLVWRNMSFLVLSFS